MKVRVLGCSGAIARDCRTTSFLVNHNILIDAGTGVGDLTLEEMRQIDHVFLTHSHLDHIAALPLMLDAVSSLRSQPVQVHAPAATIAALQAHVFNNIVWPDFSCVPSAQSPFLRYVPLAAGETVTAAGLVVLAAAREVAFAVAEGGFDDQRSDGKLGRRGFGKLLQRAPQGWIALSISAEGPPAVLAS